MDKDKIIRRALGVSAIYNLGGAFLFAFPSSAPGQLAGLPEAVPGIYRALVALFVLLFGGAYAWLAVARVIDCPMVAYSAIGKAGAFGTILMFALLGQVPARGVPPATGDLILACIFAWWLSSTRDSLTSV
jgi:hypothetical protein